jgi:glutathionylspermidine synthase
MADVTPRPLYSREITTVSILTEAREDCRSGLDRYGEETNLVQTGVQTPDRPEREGRPT